MKLPLRRCNFIKIIYIYITMPVDLYRSTQIYTYTYIHTYTHKRVFWNSSRKRSLYCFELSSQQKVLGSFQTLIVLGFVRSKGLFVILHVSHNILSPYRLLQAHFTSRRDDWQVIFHVILNKMTHTIKYMVFGSHLMKAKEYIYGQSVLITGWT